MKTGIQSSGRRSRGYALLMVLVITIGCILVLTATLGRTSVTSRLNDRNNQFTAGIYAAEAATEKVIARMKYDYLAGNLAYISNNMSIYQAAVPNTTENAIWGNYEFSDAQGHVGKTFVTCLSAVGWGPLQSQYTGLSGWTNAYRVISNVRATDNRYIITNAIAQDIQLDSIPIFQFAIFYNSLLEFTWAATLTVNGRTHANSNIFTGSAQTLTFNSPVTCTGTLTSPAWDGHTTNEYSAAQNFNGNPSYSTNAISLTLPIGTNNTPDAVREIINMPPASEDPGSAMGQQRYYNKAEIIILVNPTNVVATFRTSTNDSSPTTLSMPYSSTNYLAITTNMPFLSITNVFFDQRESDTVLTSQIDVAVLNKWIATNVNITSKFTAASGAYPNILYIADNRPTSSSVLTAIRLKGSQVGQASVIPTNMAASLGLPTGFTLATPNPLYVWGNYNCPNPSHLGTTNTTATFPASLVSDALTILSPSWNDSYSSNAYSVGVAGRQAGSTTVNAAIITGVVYSTDSTATGFSGGVMNLPRLLEDWQTGSKVLTLNTSIVNLFNSARATSQFQNPGHYYNAPSRQISFDNNFMNYAKQPPGTPTLGVIQRSTWAIWPPNTTSYTNVF